MNIVGWLVSAGFAIAPMAAQAATNTFSFNNTTVGAGAGPANPANGATSIAGTNLNNGDVVVFDGIVINVPGSGPDAWGAVELGASGYLGLTTANLGVKVETGTNNANFTSIFLPSTSFNIGVSPGSRTNRVHIELTCTQTGSTTNMNYLVEIDQGVSGSFNAVTNGTGVTFPNNAITLNFAANVNQHLFIQVQPIIAVSAPTPATNTVIPGLTATFAATLTEGYPLNTAQQWRSNGVPIIGANSLTYTTPPATASYNGAQYSVVVTNLLTPGNVVTSSAALLVVRTTPGIIAYNFPTTTTVAGYGPVTDPGVTISGNSLLVGDTIVFDGILTPNGGQPSDAWTAINIAGGGYGNVTSAKFGVLCRQGSGAGQLFTNGIYIPPNSPTSNGAPTNRVRIELYPSANGSTTNMGWMVEIDQNLSGTFQPAITGTNLTFVNNTLPLTFGSSGGSSFVYQNPESPVSIFSEPNPLQVVAVGSPVTVGVTVSGWYPAFQWRKNGGAIQNATNRTYTLASAGLADNGDQFTVVVSNRLNSLNVVTSAVANVSVLIPNNLSWYPLVDATTWDTATPNWTTNGGVSQTLFASGNNVTFDALGYNLGGQLISATGSVNPNAITVNVSSYESYQLIGASGVNAQSLYLTGDGTGYLILQAPASFATATIDAGSILYVGYGGTDDPSFAPGNITNNGSIDFENVAGVLTVSSVIKGSGLIMQDGSGTTVLSATNSACGIGAINAGAMLIASTPNPGAITNNSELQPNSPASVLVIPNPVTGTGHYAFTGFQTTILTGLSSFTGVNRLAWGPVIVDNPQALGDTNSSSTAVTGADNLGGLYLSNNIVWSQRLELDPRQNAGGEATAPHISNWSGTNIIVSPLTFANGQGGSEINVEAAAGQLTIDAASTLANNTTANANNLNLQGAATGTWNGILADGTTPLNIVKRGAGIWRLGATNINTGTTTITGGTLALASTGSIAHSSAVLVGGGATFDVSATGGWALGSSQTLGNTGSTAILNGSVNASSGTVSLTYAAGTPAFTVAHGTLTLSSGTIFNVTNTGAPLTEGSYKLISTNVSGVITGSLPAVTVGGNGVAGAVTNTLQINGGQLYLVVSSARITAVLTGNTLQLSWAAAGPGWTLETNSVGLSNTNGWFPYPGSGSLSNVNITIDPAQHNVFYRLRK